MLGIPETVLEPGPYDLLAIDRRTFRPAMVEGALKERKRLLRQNIPGPQFIPLITIFERNLDRAAVTLLDANKRKAYHDRHDRETRDDSLKRPESERRQLVLQAYKTVRVALNPDGTLDNAGRSALKGQLRRMGLREDNIWSMLDGIPAPSAKPDKLAEGAMRYFMGVVDQALEEGTPTKEEETRLMDLARRFGIPEETAAAKINEQLQAKGARREGADGQAKPGHRQMILAAYKALNEARDPDGTLEHARRAVLTEELRRIGLEENNIQSMLADVPCPPGAAPSGEESTPSSEAPAGSTTLGPGGGPADEIVVVHPAQPQTSVARTMPESETPQITPYKRKSSNPALKLVPVAAVAAFVVIAIILGRPSSTKPPPPPPIRPTPPSPERVNTTPQVDNTPEVPPEDPPGTSTVNPVTPVTRTPPTVTPLTGPPFAGTPRTRTPRTGTPPTVTPLTGPPFAGPPFAGTPRTRTPRTRTPRTRTPRTRTPRTRTPRTRTPGSTPMANQVRNVYSNTGTPENLLADIAMTIYACYARANVFQQGTNDFATELSTLINNRRAVSNRIQFLTMNISSSPSSGSGTSPAPTSLPTAKRSSLDKDTLNKLKEDIKGNRGERYAAVMALSDDNTAEAADILLDALRKKLKPRSRSAALTASRLIKALEKMDKFTILKDMATMLPKSGKTIAFQLNRALTTLTGNQHVRLRLANTTKERKSAANEWEQYIDTQQRYSTPIRSRSSRSVITSNPPAAKPVLDINLALLTVTSHWAENLSRTLSGEKPRPADACPPRLAVRLNAAGRLVSSLDKAVEELHRLVGENPNADAGTKLRAGLLKKERRVRAAASNTLLQKAAVATDIAAGLLEILIQESDANKKFEAQRKQINSNRKKAAANAQDVLHELRENCYYNLELWDLLLQLKK